MFMEIYRTTADPALAERIEELAPAAIAALAGRAPGLVRYDSARIAPGTWLDVFVWTSEDAAAAAMAVVPSIPEAVELHGLLGGAEPIGRAPLSISVGA